MAVLHSAPKFTLIDGLKDTLSGALGDMLVEAKEEHGELLLLIERGRNAVLALVVTGQERPEIREQLAGAIDIIENQFGSVLDNWDGDLGRFEGAGEIIESLVVIRESVTWYVNPMAIVGSTRDRIAGLWHRFF